MAKMGCSPHALVPVASLRSCQQRSPTRRSEEAMSLRTKFFAMTYDRQIAGAEKAGLRAFRERLLADASGDVIEIGGETGLNLSCYGSAVRSLTITEPQPPMLRRLDRAVHERRQDAKILRAPAEDLPFDNGSFDVAVSTLVLCGVDDWLNRLVVCCDCNRPTLDSIRDAGFTPGQVEHTTLPKAPKFASPTIMGAATTPSPAPARPSPAGPARRGRRVQGHPPGRSYCAGLRIAASRSPH